MNDFIKEVDEESKMLCNVIVSTTHELHANQHKSQNEIQSFLKTDCQKLPTKQLEDADNHTQVEKLNFFY
jgi:hypothetical protein